jgi:hypothetical protein
MVDERDRLLAERRHRVAPHVARAIGAPVPEEVERHHAVAALGQRAGERLVHPLVQEQPVEEHGRARPRAELGVGERLAEMCE